MNTSGSNSAQGTFDFSRPPPGYSMQNTTSSRTSTTKANYYTSASKKEPGYTTPEPPAVTDPRYAYFQGSSLAPNVTPQTAVRPPTQDFPDTSYRSHPPPPPESAAGLDPRLFGLPPPPPPADPYPTNLTVPHAGYILSSTVYAFPMAPPPGMGSIGAGQYLTQQPGNYRPLQYQGEYGSGYSKRGGFNNHLNRKRSMPQEYDSEGHKKVSTKKKKKPLSQNMPSKKDWSVADAQRALDIEREFNKRHKSPSLIIKFPDLELNRDIVSKYHPKIESVHFQQPSTPRFCFVTLKDATCMDEVIRDICKIKFGDGYLTAEPKNNKEDDLVKGPEDIDPLTLYVGNLAQEVTVEDVCKAYPKHKRIDIGFAKKMKYTRYAFVCFRTVDEAIQAFQNTHSTEMYNKSLIVRFRRLHGTVGLPGDPKPQNLQKSNNIEANPTANGSAVAAVAAAPPPQPPQAIDIKVEIKRQISESDSATVQSSDEYECYGEDLDYSGDLKSMIFNATENRKSSLSRRLASSSSRSRYNSGDSQPVVHIKDEPVDYDSESDCVSEPHRSDDIPHRPLLGIKTEPDVKPPLRLKVEKQEVKEEITEDVERRHSSESEDDDDGELNTAGDPFLSEFSSRPTIYKK